MRRYALPLALAAGLGFASLALAVDPSVMTGIPQPSAAPTQPPLRAAGFYGDPNGCVYAYANGARVLVAGSGCVFATVVATVSPFPTATPTPGPF